MGYKLFEKVAFLIFFIFAMVGGLFLSILFHELSHQQDYKGLVMDEQICAFVWPNSWGEALDWKSKESVGYYTFKYNINNETLVKQIKEIGDKTEEKAYTISIIVILILLISLFVQLRERAKRDLERELIGEMVAQVPPENK